MTKDLENRLIKLEEEVKELKSMVKELDSRTFGLIVIGGAHID